MQQLTGRSERGVRWPTRWPGVDKRRMRRSLAVLALALIPAAVGVWMTTTLSNRPDPTTVARQQRLTSAAAAALLVREQGIEARLAALAADPDVGRLSGNLSGPPGQQATASALAALRGPDGTIVSGACITSLADARSAVLVAGSDAPASTTDCASDGLLTQADQSAAGVVSRAVMPTSSGARLLVATRLEDDGASGSVLAAGIDLAELLAATRAASGEASSALIDPGRLRASG
jgi:hypothetical protein